MAFVHKVAVSTIAILAVLAGSAVAQTKEEQDQKAIGQKKESVRKQQDGLLSPKDALEQSDQEVAPDAYQPKGVDLGSFLLMPKMEVDLARNSNIYASQTNPQFDTIHTYRPEIALKSRFDQHAINATVRGERKEYQRFDRESVNNAFARLGGEYNLNDTDVLTASASYVMDHEDRGSRDDAGGVEPTRYEYYTVDSSGTMRMGDFTTTLSAQAVRRTWDDTRTTAGITPSHFRDRHEFEIKARESYEMIPGYALVGEATWLTRKYMSQTDQNGFNRDSDGIRLAAGVGFDVSEVIRGDFLAGVMRQNYESERLRDASGYYVKTMLNWMPTKLTTVIPTIERSVEETTAINTSSVISTSFSTTVRHELQRNIILGGTIGYSMDDQQGGPMSSELFSGTLRGTYLFDPNFYSTLELTQKHKISNTDGSGFNQSVGMLRFGVQY